MANPILKITITSITGCSSVYAAQNMGAHWDTPGDQALALQEDLKFHLARGRAIICSLNRHQIASPVVGGVIKKLGGYVIEHVGGSGGDGISIFCIPGTLWGSGVKADPSKREDRNMDGKDKAKQLALQYPSPKKKSKKPRRNWKKLYESLKKKNKRKGRGKHKRTP